MEFKGKQVTIMSCSHCNTQCNHCYLEYKGNFKTNELLRLAKKLSEKYQVDLNGAEPLMQPLYLESYKFLKQERVLTNGLVLLNNPEIFDQLKNNGIKWICISYIFDHHKELSNVPEEKVLKAMKLVKENGFNLEIMTTVSKTNYQNIENFVIQAIKLNADCIRFTNLFNSGNAKNMENVLLTRDDINIFFDMFYAIKEKYNDIIKVRRSGTFGRDDRKQVSRFNCPAGEERVAVTPDGNVYPCPFLTSKKFIIGKLENDKIIINKKLNYNNKKCLLLEYLNFNKNFVFEEE